MTNPLASANPRNTRSDGWTREKQQQFLAALGECGSVTEAVRRVGMSKQSVYELRRHPAAVAFRAAWDEALVDAWRRVAETALERVVNGETEIYQKDGVEVIRHRPCAPHLLVHMLDRAEAVIAKARRRANAEAEVMFQEHVKHVREEIHQLSKDPDEVAAARARQAALPPLVKPVDGETLALRHHHDLLRKLPDLSARLSVGARTPKKRQVGQLMSGTAALAEAAGASP